MPRKGAKGEGYLTCPKCGSKVLEPVRTWTMVSPIPDRQGRVTVTIMGSFICGECGHRWNAPMKRIKSGGEESPGEPLEAGEPQVIELDIEDIMRERI